MSNRDLLDSFYPPADVFVMNADGTGVKNLTRGPNWNIQSTPSLSSHGSRVAFADNLTPGCAQIWTIHTDGSAPAQVTTQHCSYVPRWSPPT